MSSRLPFDELVTGGQTGVDRAALDIAESHRIPCHGWCPKGRLAEDGVIDARYNLRETVSSACEERTELNARDSDGTLILAFGEMTGGTAFTRDCAVKYKRPVLLFDVLAEPPDPIRFRAWLTENQIRILNIAGPRESAMPGTVYRRSLDFLSDLFEYSVP